MWRGAGEAYRFEASGVGFAVLGESVGDREVLEEGDDTCSPACGEKVMRCSTEWGNFDLLE